MNGAPWLWAALLPIAGCASVSDVTPTGPGTYMVAAHGIDGNGSGAAQKVVALQKANAFCAGRTAHIELIGAQSVEPAFGRPPSAEVAFRCVAD